jgi:peptidoglycan-associated lipoprotein
MKKSLFYLFTIATLIFTGCGGSSEGLDPKAGEKTEQKADTAVPEQAGTQAAATETGVSEEAAVATAAEEPVTESAEKMDAGVTEMAIYFDFDKFNIRGDMASVVENAASKLKDVAAGTTVKIEGNCDEWGTDEYNYALGLKRAKSVKDTLVKYGVSEANLKLISYGESNPVCNEKNEACWSKNRRVEFKLSR